MYFLVEGYAVATKYLESQDSVEQVMSYKVGDFFGELALLKN